MSGAGASTGCGAGNQIGDGSIYELFTAASPFDLSNTGQTYVWTSNGYIVLDGAGAIVPPTGSPATYGDDQTQVVTLPFAFPCTQGLLQNIYLCSNGWISFEPTTSTDWPVCTTGTRSGCQSRRHSSPMVGFCVQRMGTPWPSPA